MEISICQLVFYPGDIGRVDPAVTHQAEVTEASDGVNCVLLFFGGVEAGRGLFGAAGPSVFFHDGFPVDMALGLPFAAEIETCFVGFSVVAGGDVLVVRADGDVPCRADTLEGGGLVPDF